MVTDITSKIGRILEGIRFTRFKWTACIKRMGNDSQYYGGVAKCFSNQSERYYKDKFTFGKAITYIKNWNFDSPFSLPKIAWNVTKLHKFA